MSEHVEFHGILRAEASGEPISLMDLDFGEGWPVVVRHNFHLPATSGLVTVTLGDVGTAKILGIKSDKEITVRMGTSGADAFTCRGVMVIQCSVTQLHLANTSSWTGGNDVFVLAAGVE